MNQTMQLNLTRLLKVLAVLCSAHWLCASDVASLTEQAELVVVGKAARQGATAAGTVTATLRVDRILKGAVGASVTVEIEPFRAGAQALIRLPNECGMWFLVPKGGDKWRPVVQNPDPSYFPVPNCVGASSLTPPSGAQLADRIALELISAADSFEGQKEYAGRLYSLLGRRLPMARAELVANFSSRRNPHLLATALAFQIEQQDAAALQRMELDSELFAQSPARFGLYNAVSKYRNPQLSGVQVLGRIVSRSGAPATRYLQSPASEALAMIHTQDTVPYLVDLLSSSDSRFRAWAVHGLSLFRLKLPPQTDDKFQFAVRDALHPGGQPLAGKEREFIHFGRFQDPATEAAHVAYYQSWWAENRAALGF